MGSKTLFRNFQFLFRFLFFDVTTLYELSMKMFKDIKLLFSTTNCVFLCSCNHHVVCAPPNINLSQMGNDIFLKNAFVKENVIRFQFWLIESFPRKEKHRRPNILQRVEILINWSRSWVNDTLKSVEIKFLEWVDDEDDDLAMLLEV